MDGMRKSGEGEEGLVQQIRDLLRRSEHLANEVARKEVILNSIEYKMFEVSKRVVKATDFSKWIDAVLQDNFFPPMKSHDSDLCADREVDSTSNWMKLYDVIGKYVQDTKTTGIDYVNRVDKWMAEKLSKEVKLEVENKEYKTIISKIEGTVSKFSNICSILQKHMTDIKYSCDENCNIQEEVDRWLTEKRKSEIKLEKENAEYKKIIANIEHGVSKLDTKIENFTECLSTCTFAMHFNSTAKNPYISTKDALEYIQAQIRSLNDEDSDFQIKDFPKWLEKVKMKIEELELNVANEKNKQSTKQKQHAVEREILNYLFNQKQKEISILKEKVCNKAIFLNHQMPFGRVEG